jgi:3'-5' exoribonuclease
MSIEELKQAAAAQTSGVEVTFHAQVQSVTSKTTRGGKPYLELTVADSTGTLSFKVWSDNSSFRTCTEMKPREFVAISGVFKNTEYGIESPQWRRAPLDEAQIAALLAGDTKQAERIEAEMAAIDELVTSMKSRVYREVCRAFTANTTIRRQFMRAAAARGNHHARRGGLVEHTAQMMRAADALAVVYGKQVNRSLLLAGVLFHDCGKMFENQYEEDGFLMPFNDSAELLGHISIGVELVRKLWRETISVNGERHEEYRAEMLALCHLILSHHGELEYGSPVQPKMIEAQMLHFIDNIDAKVEMMRTGYLTSAEVAPGIFERSYPLRVNLVRAPAEGE